MYKLRLILLGTTISLVCAKPLQKFARGSIEELSSSAPNLHISKNSQEGIQIANQIAALFLKENRPILADFPSEYGLETNSITGTPSQTTINFNFNIALDVSDGEISPIRLPQGNLVVLFIAANQDNRVNIKPDQFKHFLQQTFGRTHMAKISGNGRNNPGGIAFMAWAKTNATNSPFKMNKEHDGVTVGNLNNIKNTKGTTAEAGTTSINTVKASSLFSGSNGHNYNTQQEDVTADEMHDRITSDPIIREEWNKGAIPKFPFYHGVNTLGGAREKAADNYRIDASGNEREQINRISELNNLGIHSFHQGVTQSKNCNTRNGITKCKEEPTVSRPCQGFVIGGNCGGQNTFIDNNIQKINPPAKNSIQMGHIGGSNKRFGLKRKQPTKLLIQNSFLEDTQDDIQTTTTTSATPSTTLVSTTDVVSTMDPHLQEMHDHIMSMNAHDLRDAIMDPMMLGMGLLMAMSGAYMAMIMAETSAANAFAFNALNG